MKFRLLLNGNAILTAVPKEIFQVFDCLSGLSFGRGHESSWLNKMTAADAYLNYLRIKAKELGVDTWEGELMVVDELDKPVRVHFFETHQAVTQSAAKKDVS